MRVDIHNHTILCNHAHGSVDEYIKRAIELGIDIYGFSCHSPMKFDPKYRMRLEELDIYYKMIKNAQKTYGNKIQILCGLEVDFIDNRQDLIEQKILDYPFDYLVGSIHFLDEWGFDNPEFIGEYVKKDMEECWRKYLQAITHMAQTKLFQIVGHFDLLKIFGHTPNIKSYNLIKKALQTIKDTQMVLEINSAGLRKPVKEQYPSVNILEIAKTLEIPITFGSDAHSVDQVGYGYKECLEIVKNIGYKKATYFINKIPHEIEI
ncbi:histidinol-phosphatase [Helicobacter cappadocius]|uniref:Histidinol-phosphatase n=1 Tax=Helicobacter cappadocius TaxID=3063998 RepID=A0AA90PLI3_9HELI|nr:MULTISPECIES: histidinol-phosphatase [unclassified Helicobacter]MDO7253702.1 histidinol-phosphatase [Helicobacter sp. faydin-H75]MDP2539610.1 histidinol-phosphatase [Helicobacter sp. faydin-H76]